MLSDAKAKKDKEYLEKLQQKIVDKLCEDFKSEVPTGVDPVKFKEELIKEIVEKEFLETLAKMLGENRKDKTGKSNDLGSKEVN